MGFDLTCPMPSASVKWDDDGNERIGIERHQCGESLFLIYETSTDILDDRALHPGRMDAWGHTPEGAVSQVWKVECINGHVLLLPPEDGTDEQHHIFNADDVHRLKDAIASMDGRVEEHQPIKE